jgi:hypothetical protein
MKLQVTHLIATISFSSCEFIAKPSRLSKHALIQNFYLQFKDGPDIIHSVQIGWPSSLPTNEKDAFVRNIMKAKVTVIHRYWF